MYKQATAALAALALAGGALGLVPPAGAQDEFPLTDGCILLLEFDPGACDGPPEPTPEPTPTVPQGPQVLEVCHIDIFGASMCPDDDEPTPTPTGPQVFETCHIDPVTLTDSCDDGDGPDDPGDDGGDDPGDDGGDGGDDPGDDGGDGGDDPGDDDTEGTGGIDPADPADPIDGDPNFTG